MPVFNEKACVGEVIIELHRVLDRIAAPYEIIAVDDGSTDGTCSVLTKLAGRIPELHVLRLPDNTGKTAALIAGFNHAMGEIIVTIDADGQNDPADIPRLLAELENCDVCCGYRQNKQHPWSKKVGSYLANAARNLVLHEKIRDTGCCLKAFRKEFLEELPKFRGLQRFLPAWAAVRGALIRQIPVNDRPRRAGRSKYTNIGRLKETVSDLFAVRWMKKRYLRFRVEKHA